MNPLVFQGTTRPAGYAALRAMFGLEFAPNWHTSLVQAGTTHQVSVRNGSVEERYPASYWPGDSPADHLEFALKYDGVNLAILFSVFQAIPPSELTNNIQSKPTGRNVRRLWFLYEFLTGARLPIDDIGRGPYIDLLDSSDYYTVAQAEKVRRHRINNNLLGDARFCPIVRRTELLRAFEMKDLTRRCEGILSDYSPELLRRASSYLYTKETKSSYAIEHVKPTSNRVERFVGLLQSAGQEDFVEKQNLLQLQNRIVDPRFAESDYRNRQNYVGETVAWQSEKVHFVSPRPEDLADLMAGLIAAHARMEFGGVLPAVHAAVLSYGFVFLHPFEDGNGRIHRFLIHNILARRKFTPAGVIVPVSAYMLKHAAEYDASLEAFSQALLPLIEYSLDENGQMTVHGETGHWYRFMDMTTQAEALYRFLEQTIETELAQELAFLVRYDEAKQAIQNIVDMPDRKIDLFIRLCLQNNGRFSARKRAEFGVLTDAEVADMERVVQAVYQL